MEEKKKHAVFGSFQQAGFDISRGDELAPDDIPRVLKTFKISRLDTFRGNGVGTLERKDVATLQKRCGHFYNNAQCYL